MDGQAQHADSYRTQAPPARPSWSADGNEDDDDYEADENSELNRHRRTESNQATHQYSSPTIGLDRNGDGGENGHASSTELDDEKSFRYYKELPDHTKLYNAKSKAPGIRAIGAGLLMLAGVGYLLAYLCTSVSRACHQ